ncbi:hypothetical protein CHS0354_027360 [Potamilus streckersoni]|uniref:Tr-type G domain-containing protein n=1 Tax=Potamilus streckersoni TaxID=2493646 RepID=A0AAE0SQ58_9BIVA|nr:hypothetical protein CHS0354_027360 [Potamilus streckersoni]
MSRRRKAEVRQVNPDAKYNNYAAAKFINCLMERGKKSVAEKIFYGAVSDFNSKVGQGEELNNFLEAVEKVKPDVEVRSRRVGGATYQVPVEVRTERRLTLAIRWMITAARARSVHDGAATMDWMPQEQERGITITAAATTCEWEYQKQKYGINIIDTPGHVDFSIEVERSLRVLDGAVIVMCAVSGIQPQTETIWRQTENRNIPRLIFVNKIDRKGARYAQVVEDVKRKFGKPAVLINYPVYDEDKIAGFVDIIRGVYLAYEDELGQTVVEQTLSQGEKQRADILKNQLIENLSDFDDELAEKYLSGEVIEASEITDRLKKLTRTCQIIPACTGASFKNRGVQFLLNSICEYLPPPTALSESAEVAEEVKKQAAKGSLAAFVFKVFYDTHGGFLFYVRVYAGTLTKGTAVYNAGTGKKERVLKIYKMHSNRREEIESCSAGDICACVGLNHSNSGDTLTDGAKILLAPIRKLTPVISVSAEAGMGADEDKLNEVLGIISREDPSFNAEKNPDTGQMIMSGMGELHLEVIAERIRRDFGVAMKVGKPQVSYREAVGAETVLQDELIRTEGKNTYKLSGDFTIGPAASDEVKIEADNRKLNRHAYSLYCQTLAEFLKYGVQFGYPLIRTELKLSNLELSSDDIPEAVVKTFLGLAVRKLLQKASSVVLEPVMRVQVISPFERTGDVIANLNMNSAKIISVEESDGMNSINCEVFLSNMFGYSTALRSLTQGRGSYTMDFAYYDSNPNK